MPRTYGFTASQTRLTPEQRLHNVAGAFRVPADVARLRGLHVLLVDDVVTTAATLNACATALFDGGARIISYVTFGRARCRVTRRLSEAPNCPWPSESASTDSVASAAR